MNTAFVSVTFVNLPSDLCDAATYAYFNMVETVGQKAKIAAIVPRMVNSCFVSHPDVA